MTTPAETSTGNLDPYQVAQLRRVLGAMPYAPLAGYHGGGRPITTFAELLEFLERFAEELRGVGERDREREEKYFEMRRDQVAIGRMIRRAIEADAKEKEEDRQIGDLLRRSLMEIEAEENAEKPEEARS